jgi:hypothetical protein
VGDVLVEDLATVHWAENMGSEAVLLGAVDIFKRQWWPLRYKFIPEAHKQGCSARLNLERPLWVADSTGGRNGLAESLSTSVQNLAWIVVRSPARHA